MLFFTQKCSFISNLNFTLEKKIKFIQHSVENGVKMFKKITLYSSVYVVQYMPLHYAT